MSNCFWPTLLRKVLLALKHLDIALVKSLIAYLDTWHGRCSDDDQEFARPDSAASHGSSVSVPAISVIGRDRSHRSRRHDTLANRGRSRSEHSHRRQQERDRNSRSNAAAIGEYLSMKEVALHWSQSFGTITSFLLLHIAKMFHHYCSWSSQEFSFWDIWVAEAQAWIGWEVTACQQGWCQQLCQCGRWYRDRRLPQWRSAGESSGGEDQVSGDSGEGCIHVTCHCQEKGEKNCFHLDNVFPIGQAKKQCVLACHRTLNMAPKTFQK